VIEEGQVLAGRYKLVRPLGQGSQAFVWVAEHLALGSQVAVKLIDPELAKQEDARERFRREATAAAQLRSAHVVQILDHGIEGDQPFIVMELLEGEDLFDRLEKRERLSLLEAATIVTQVARALARAHAAGIVHRDMKPENVFLCHNDDEELVKVLDFGVAKITSPQKAAMSKTGVGTLIGTPHYMSPEQVKGLTEIDHRSDLWSLGVITYQMVTGELPFDSEGVGDLLIRITMNDPKPPSALEPALPKSFDEWFARACHKDPDQRFASARELAEALARLAGIEGKASRAGVDKPSASETSELDWEEIEVAGPSVFPPSVDESPAPALPPPPPAPRLAVPPAPVASNPFLEAAPVSAARPPAPPRPPTPSAPPETPHSAPPVSRMPASARSGPMQSTVAGLSADDSPIDVLPELDGSRKRRTLWVLGIAATIGVLVIAGTIARSHLDLGSSGSTVAAPPASPSSLAPRPLATVPPAPTVSTTPSTSAAPEASGSATDLSVTKKPTTTAKPPTGTGPMPRTKPASNPDEVVIEIPLPDREVPAR
jgi:serine/threonine-protein kinase